MRERLDKLAGGARARLVGRHLPRDVRAPAAHVRRDGGLARDFVIYDDADQRTLVARVLKDLGDRRSLRHAARDALAPSTARRTSGEGPDDFQGHDYFSDIVARVYPDYQRAAASRRTASTSTTCSQGAASCASDDRRSATSSPSASTTCWSTSSRTPTTCSTGSSSTSSARPSNLCVVGDDDQSIYRWRGADVRNILDFERDFPSAKVVKLEQNYRSTQLILDAANAVIARNLEREQKQLCTEQRGRRADPLSHRRGRARRGGVRRARDPASSSSTRAAPPTTSPSSIACTRSRACSKRRCCAADMPYKIVGGTRFYERAEVKDLLAYLRVIANPPTRSSLERIINVPTRGIGESTYEKCVEARAPSAHGVEAMRRLPRARDRELLGAGRARSSALRRAARRACAP